MKDTEMTDKLEENGAEVDLLVRILLNFAGNS